MRGKGKEDVGKGVQGGEGGMACLSTDGVERGEGGCAQGMRDP